MKSCRQKPAKGREKTHSSKGPATNTSFLGPSEKRTYGIPGAFKHIQEYGEGETPAEKLLKK